MVINYLSFHKTVQIWSFCNIYQRVFRFFLAQQMWSNCGSSFSAYYPATLQHKHHGELFQTIEVSAVTMKWQGFHYESSHVLISLQERHPCHLFFFLSRVCSHLIRITRLVLVFNCAKGRKGEQREQLCLLYNFVGSNSDWSNFGLGSCIRLHFHPSPPVQVAVLKLLSGVPACNEH